MEPDRHDLVESRLRASRPRPDAEFVAALERRLLPSGGERKPRRLRRPLFAAAGTAGALATVVLALGLADTGPLAGDGQEGVEARDDCRFVLERKRVRAPEIVTGADGQPTLRYRSRVVSRRVKRCD